MFRRPFALVLAALPLLVGCGHIYRVPCDAPPWRPADTVPDCSKASVHVFLFDCYDPFAAGWLGEVRDHLNDLGFGKTHYGWPHHLKHFQVELGTVNAENPVARFAIIGFGYGAKAARDLAAFADAIGAPVDAVILLEPSGLDPADEVAAAANTFVLRGVDLNDYGPTFVPRHFQKAEVPTHPTTLELIEREVVLMAMGVPIPPRRPAPPVILVPPMPAPRDTRPAPMELPPEWQFLRVRAPWLQLGPPPPGTAEPLPYPRRLPDELPPPGRPESQE
jgi:hypothetical protein